jgi:hypothetical protein
MHMQPKSGYSGGPDASQQAGQHQPGNPFGEASNDAAENGLDMSIESAFAMNQQMKNPTEDSTQLEVVYDKKALKDFGSTLSVFVTMCMQGKITKVKYMVTVQKSSDQELVSKGIGPLTAVLLPAPRKRKNDQALAQGPRTVTNAKFRAHLVAAAMSKLKEAQRKVNKDKV